MLLADAVSGLGPIRSESTAVLVARRIRDLIARGKFTQGQQLVEVELAKKFGVSRGILREAMQRLTQEGLLVARLNHGVFVAELGADDVFDIYTARLAIERAACLKVIGVMGAEVELADELDALCDQLEGQMRDGATDGALASLDIAFHERMVAAAKSPRLTRMHATLATESQMCSVAYESQVYPMSERLTEHREIAAAIRNHDVPELHSLLAAHMDHAVDMIVLDIAAREVERAADSAEPTA